MKAKSNFNIGDHVSVISDTLKGVVVKIENQVISIECEDGFEYSFPPHELLINMDWSPLISILQPKITI